MIFGFLVFPGLEELDLVGPWDLIALWARIGRGPKRCLTVGQDTSTLVCANGMSIVPQVSLAECPRLDYLLVPGGQGARKQVDNEVLVRFIADQAKTCQAVLSVCTGAFLLHQAGLLSGRRATTHWAWIDRLAALGNVQVCRERVVQDANIWTSAGVTAGIDLALAFIASAAGDEIAGKIQLGAEYYPTTKLFGEAHKNPLAPAYLNQTSNRGQ
jgi:transcriptional regulator GlxA family with amidase domain